ncbi:hypothetical protein HYR99_25720 [Candidatus Poribacteria bacterium]|nr:hypothetical protein [Candidatus Poribacteria bacterium]
MDKEGLDGIDVKEALVLISDQIVQLDRQVISSSESLGQKVVEGNELLRQDIKAVHQDIQLIHQELVDFRKEIGFWIKVLVTGIWGVFASLIADLIFRIIAG